MNILKQIFCRHKEITCITNLHGDLINIYECRSLWECKRCKKVIKSKELNKQCKYVNFHLKEGK